MSSFFMTFFLRVEMLGTTQLLCQPPQRGVRVPFCLLKADIAKRCITDPIPRLSVLHAFMLSALLFRRKRAVFPSRLGLIESVDSDRVHVGIRGHDGKRRGCKPAAVQRVVQGT